MKNSVDTTGVSLNSYREQMNAVKLIHEAKLNNQRALKLKKIIEFVKVFKTQASNVMAFIYSEMFIIPKSLENLTSSRLVTDSYEACVIELEKIVGDILALQKTSYFILGYEEAKSFSSNETEDNLLQFVCNSIFEFNSILTRLHSKLSPV